MAGIDGIGVENWRSKPVKEVVNNIDVVQEEDSEVATWAQAMAAIAGAPDNVTYDMAGGSTEEFTAELEAITQNGLAEGQAAEAPEGVEGVEEPEAVPEEEAKEEEGVIGEEKDDVGDVPDDTKPEGEEGEVDPNAPPKDVTDSETAEDTEEPDALANDEVNTDNEEIEKRKRKQGEVPE